MSKISVVMPAYNAEKYISEAIESILIQSFEDFELIIIDDGSTDNTVNIIRSYDDKRIVLLQNNHDFIGSLNLGLQKAKGKYIARMDTDDIMHTDRLKIQYAIMEEETSITVCCTWMIYFGEEIKNGSVAKTLNGLVENPLLELLRGNFVFHPATIIRKDFLEIHHIQYQHYDYAEDYKLWSEIAKKKGVFYIESQPLLHYRISKNQVSHIKIEEQNTTSYNIQSEIIEYFINQNKSYYPQLESLYSNLISMREDNLISPPMLSSLFYNLFAKNKNKLRIT